MIRATLPNGLKLVMFPKKTRGGTVVAQHRTSASATRSRSSANPLPARMAGALLMRGTKNKNRQQIQDETDRLKAQINVSGGVDRRLRRTSGRWRPTWPIRCALRGSCCASPRSPKPSSSRSASSASPAPRAARPSPAPWPPLDMNRHMNAQYPARRRALCRHHR